MISGISADGICEKLKSTFDKCGDFNLRPVLCAGKAVYLANIGNFSGRTYITESVVKPLIARRRAAGRRHRVRGHFMLLRSRSPLRL